MPTAPQRLRDPKELGVSIERGPASVPDSDTGHAWLDRRSDASGMEGALMAVDRQRRIKQLGETAWQGHPSIQPDMKGPEEQPGLPTKGGRSVTHLYRGVSEAEFQEAKGRGSVQSDQRGVIIEGWEGTNAATDPASAHVYMPRQGTGRILKMEARPEDKWFSTTMDPYARTREPIPWDRVVAHTEEFAHPDSKDNTELNLREHVKGLEKVEQASTVLLGGNLKKFHG